MSEKMICIDETVGNLLPQYELNTLSPDDMARFETHLLDCDFCREESNAFRAVADLMHVERTALLAELGKQGLTFESLSRQSEQQAPQLSQASRKPSARNENWFNRFRQPWIWGPALGIACIVILLAVVGPHRDSSYKGLIAFDPLPYTGEILRGGDQAETAFQSGIRAYENSNYSSAISRFENTVKLDSAHSAAWLYLGISYYLTKQAEPAVKTLITANRLNTGENLINGRWYLAQSYVLKGDYDSALAVCDRLATPGNPRFTQATALREMLVSLKKK